MRRNIAIAVCLSAIAIAPLASAGSVSAQPEQGHTQLETKYLKFYWQVVRVDGRRTPGRNIVTRGFLTHGRVRDASKGELARSIRTFRRWLAPPPPPAPAPSDHAVSAAGLPASPAYQGGKWSIPSSIVMCESGGSYTATNPSSGAYGAYQILPSTSASLGCDMATPQGQDACAAKVWATQGRGAWVC